MKTIFVTGIDTGVGKTAAAGLLAKHLLEKGEKVITLKIVETGAAGFSEDIKTHRNIMGIALTEEDQKGLTCPYLFSLPASPRLSANREGKSIDCNKILSSLHELQKNYSTVILEGAGGLFVPLNERELIVDFIQKNRFPVVLVSSPRLGSINHTLLSLEALKNRGIKIIGIVYNLAVEADPLIVEDTRKTIQDFYPKLPIVDLPDYKKNPLQTINFSEII
ncbi:MAG TPA: dethiobiotin synthase [Spirochaetia bacterium]|nr:MAG: dethiobiotin synthase [Spirochaetes bacterium GWB1_36_13]HCL57190.1 dethiobiotin synthase [Spirochaetia bacterium]